MKYIILFLILFIATGSYAYSQGPDSGQPAPQPAADQAPQNQQQSQQPSDYPDYIVKPKEDLNPYGMSSLGESTTDTSRDAAGTLGTGTTRPSNLELNKEIEEKKKEKLKELPKDKEGENGTKIDYDTAYPTEEKYQDIKSTPVKTKIYRWTDDKGMTHVTNDLGSVPEKYMNQVMGNTKSK